MKQQNTQRNIFKFTLPAVLELSTRVDPMDWSSGSPTMSVRAETFTTRTLLEPKLIEGTEYMEKC
jgi:hypothetical protein